MEKPKNIKDATAVNPPFAKNYANEFLVLESGEGCYLHDIKGNKYLDFGSGISVNSLGYGREDLANIIYEQSKKLLHVSNLYTTRPALLLAAKLTSLGDFAAVHFGNSGAEANEAALKYARLYSKRKKNDNSAVKFLSFTSGFHGRTMGSLSVTPNPTYSEIFQPLIPECYVSEFNNVEALESILDSSFAGVIVEPIQGEGGLTPASKEFAAALNSLCAKHDVILIADEIQTGLGRTGYPFASAIVGLNPDIITLAKPLAGGLPLSATLIPAKVNDLIKVGEHGTTFGGGPLTCNLANHILDLLLDPEFLFEIIAKGDYMRSKIEDLAKKYSFVGQYRGAGLLTGFTIDTGDMDQNMKKSGEVIAKAKEAGLLILRSGKNVIRLAPPLVISEKELDLGFELLEEALKGVFVK
ncbi:MAG: aspartate aminotransferase family protein [Spirochaetales bacterium]|nr:aspartate aminotransferase family protein [Spirochaetales bacterium]